MESVESFFLDSLPPHKYWRVRKERAESQSIRVTIATPRRGTWRPTQLKDRFHTAARVISGQLLS